MFTTYITGVSDALPTALFVYLQRADSSAEHMSGVGEGEQHVVKESETPVIAIRHEMPHSLVDILLVIERFDEVFGAFLLMGVLAIHLLIVHPHVLFLNERRVGEHERA